MRLLYIPLLLLTGVLFVSCGSYRQNILFQVDAATYNDQKAVAESNYTIQSNDLLSLDVFTNQGEKIVDPNRESFKDGNAVGADPSHRQYLVDMNGMVKFPLIDPIRIQGLTLQQAEDILEKAYEEFYEGAYVLLKYTNKRVIVLGAPGGQVIPLNNENMRLTEVLALAKGVTTDGRGNNIRVIRQDQVMVANLTTFDGYKKSNIIMMPGDIVYIEPVRRPFLEGMRDYSPLITIVTSVATLIFIISQSNGN
ncbi:MAG TPA: polysaccharide biosynthesis/export family protein [Chryseosolibacter sp.]